MNETTDPQTGHQAPPAGATPPPPGAGQPGGFSSGVDALWARIRRMRRTRHDRILAGVCGGIARGLGVDTLLVRVVVGVLVFFGGAGIVIYALGWLFLPEEGRDDPIALEAVGRGRQPASARTIVLGVLLAVVAISAIGAVLGKWEGILLLALLVTGVVLLLERRRDGGRPAYAPGPSPYAPPTSYAAPSSYAVPSPPASPTPADGPQDTPVEPTTDHAPPPTAAGPSSDGGAVTQQLPTAAPPTRTDDDLPPTGPPAPPQQWFPPQPPTPPAPPRQRSALFGLTASTTLLALGALGVADASGADITWGAYWALALAVVGTGLLVGTRYGRSRGLVVVGIVLALGTFSAISSEQWGPDGKVDVDIKPTSAADVPTSADYGAGTVRYDLSAVDFAGADEDLTVSLGAGEIIVVVPAAVDVTVDGRTGVGQLDLFSYSSGGFGREHTLTDTGADGPGGGTLTLDLETGAGHVEVRRG